MSQYPVEIFCGTGGVGKTTLATSRAIYLASQGKKVLLMTIDPSKRLKQVLGIQHHKEPTSVRQDPRLENYLFALLVDPSTTMERISQEHHLSSHEENFILKALTKPFGGMNEIFALEELSYRYAQKEFDYYILDTAPGGHFIDFLRSSQKLRKFFDRKYIELFKVLKREKGNQAFFTKIISSGVDKLFSYLEQVTAKSFIHAFIDAIQTFHLTRESFEKAWKIQDQLIQENKLSWYLVTSAEQSKVYEALELYEKSKAEFHRPGTLLINRCLGKSLKDWNPKSKKGIQLKKTLLDREAVLKNHTQASFERFIEFSDILQNSPWEQAICLAKQWQEGET